MRTEGVQLNDMPIPPADKSKRPKGYVAKKPEEDPDWIEYWYSLINLIQFRHCYNFYIFVFFKIVIDILTYKSQ